MSSALNPDGADTGGLHLETISTYPEDYRAAHLILTRGLWRSGPVRRLLILSHYLKLLAWSAAAGVAVTAYYIAEGLSRGVRFGATARWLAGMLPEFLVIILVIPALFVAARCAFLAWHQRRVRRQREAAVAGGYAMTLAWNGERFGIVIDGRLHAEPIADLLAWQETDTHLFVVMREAEVLFPIRLADIDPAALLPLRQALAAAELPDLWTYAERDLLRRLTAQPAPGPELFQAPPEA